VIFLRPGEKVIGIKAITNPVEHKSYGKLFNVKFKIARII
jgi:hypothetical protein